MRRAFRSPARAPAVPHLPLKRTCKVRQSDRSSEKRRGANPRAMLLLSSRHYRRKKAPLTRFALLLVFLAAVSYAFVAFPRGVRVWQGKQRLTGEKEEDNSRLVQTV